MEEEIKFAQCYFIGATQLNPPMLKCPEHGMTPDLENCDICKYKCFAVSKGWPRKEKKNEEPNDLDKQNLTV